MVDGSTDSMLEHSAQLISKSVSLGEQKECNIGRNIVDLFTTSSEAPDSFLDRADEPFCFRINKKVIVVEGCTDSMLERSTQLISKFMSLGTLGLEGIFSFRIG